MVYRTTAKVAVWPVANPSLRAALEAASAAVLQSNLWECDGYSAATAKLSASYPRVLKSFSSIPANRSACFKEEVESVSCLSAAHHEDQHLVADWGEPWPWRGVHPRSAGVQLEQLQLRRTRWRSIIKGGWWKGSWRQGQKEGVNRTRYVLVACRVLRDARLFVPQCDLAANSVNPGVFVTDDRFFFAFAKLSSLSACDKHRVKRVHECFLQWCAVTTTKSVCWLARPDSVHSGYSQRYIDGLQLL